MDAGYRGRAAPCQRERSDRALDRVTAVETFHRGDVPRQSSATALRSPGRSRTVTATCRQSAGERSEAGAVDLQPRDIGIRGRDRLRLPPPNRHNRYSRKTLNRPLCFYARPSRPSCAFRGPRTAMCHGAPGHERVFQRFVFFQLGGPTRPAPRYVDGGLSCRLTATDMCYRASAWP